MGEVTPPASGGLNLRPPEPLSTAHDVREFICGEPSLDEWLQRRAFRSEGKTARAYVACHGDVVVGYYCLSASDVERERAPKPLQRNAPDHVPVFLMGRLAVHRSFQGHGIGAGLLKDAVTRCLLASVTIGARALLVHAIDAKAAEFYARYGFLPSPIDPRMLMLPLATASVAVTG